MLLAKKSQRRHRTSGAQTVEQLAKLLLATSEIWLKLTGGSQSNLVTRAEASCPKCAGRGSVTSERGEWRWIGGSGLVRVKGTCPRCGGRTVSAEEVGDAVAAFVRAASRPERMVVALADLGVAWHRLDRGTQNRLGEFIVEGDPEIQLASHRTAILKLWRSLYRLGEFRSSDRPARLRQPN